MEQVVMKQDERLHDILEGLGQGKSRDQVSQELGYKNYRSLDMYMKRKNYTWDPNKNYYFPTQERPVEDYQDIPKGRAATVLSLFKRGMDSKDIAKQLKFDHHRDMAKYMKSKGYVWDDADNNYVVEKEEDFHDPQEEASEANESLSQENLKEEKPILGVSKELVGQYVDLLQFLAQHRDRLTELLVVGEATGDKIPRYVLPGVHVTKSVHMVYGLDQLVREFSKEKNVSQREIFEVALVHFFRSYGYEKEINTLIGS
jgi:hypothetical protein